MLCPKSRVEARQPPPPPQEALAFAAVSRQRSLARVSRQPPPRGSFLSLTAKRKWPNNNDKASLHDDKKDDHNLWWPLELRGTDETVAAWTLWQDASIQLLSRLIRQWLLSEHPRPRRASTLPSRVPGPFRDLACTREGQAVLEGVLGQALPEEYNHTVWQGAVVALQSLAVYGAQMGAPPTTTTTRSRLPQEASGNSLKADKPRAERAALQLLAACRKRQSALGAWDLLQRMGAWSRHEFIPLLRSTWNLDFTPQQQDEAQQIVAAHQFHQRHNGSSSSSGGGDTEKEETTSPRALADVDALLGLRRDLRSWKVFTIDPANPLEVDDGLSVERLENGQCRLWIHIADAHSWIDRSPVLYAAAQHRTTSLYLPHFSIPLFPPCLGNGVMSLGSGVDCRALSLGVQLREDGSLEESSLIVTPSLIRVAYPLTYPQVDEMLEEGVAYQEEWELGHLLDVAKKRRAYRMAQGSMEGLVPHPIPKALLHVTKQEDDWDIALHVQVSHNAGHNQSATNLASCTVSNTPHSSNVEPVSSSYLLVSEMMILAGEAMGKFGILCQTKKKKKKKKKNAYPLIVPYRTQPPPDFSSRPDEALQLERLQREAHPYCHSWYARRFFKPVRISTTTPKPHSLLGLECYVQWTSPIRRFSDLQVHLSVKRFLRCERVQSLWKREKQLPPPQVTFEDLGVDLDTLLQFADKEEEDDDNDSLVPHPIDFFEGGPKQSLGQSLQRQAHEYWMLEYIRRLHAQSPSQSFKCLVLGCTDYRRWQYAVYVAEWGLETKYKSEMGQLALGQELFLCVDTVDPPKGLLTFTLSSKSGGIAGGGGGKTTSAAAAA